LTIILLIKIENKTVRIRNHKIIINMDLAKINFAELYITDVAKMNISDIKIALGMTNECFDNLSEDEKYKKVRAELMKIIFMLQVFENRRSELMEMLQSLRPN